MDSITLKVLIGGINYDINNNNVLAQLIEQIRLYKVGGSQTSILMMHD